MTLNTSRRGFLKGAAAAAAVLYIGARPDGALAAGGEPSMLTPFVRIDADGRVTAIVKHFEMGQGPSTGLTTLIAEELGVTMEQIDFDFAPSNPELYNNLFFGPFQGTGGSTAMANSFTQYRTAGAAAREMLIQAAAKAWGVDAGELSLSEGVISGAGQSAPLGEFVAAAAAMEVPAEPRLKDPSEFTLIGNPAVKRMDNGAKTTGKAMFAMDMQLDNQMVAVIQRTPRMGGLAVGFDDSGAQGIKGYIRSAILPNKAGVVVFAETTWAAFQAREALEIEWDDSAAEMRSSSEVKDQLIAAVNADPEYNVTGADLSVTSAALDGAETVVDRTYYFPLLAHAPMEPLTCTIEPTADGGVILHDGAQMPTGPHMALSSILELPMDKVQVHTMFAGGSFGRRATPTADYQVEAALAFAVTDRTRPVKLVWSREDDVTGGYYRPAVAHRVRVGLDADGGIVGWDHRVAAQSIMKGTSFEAMMVQDGVDHSALESLPDTPYALPGMFVGLTDVAKATSVLWWRSVGNTHTAYVIETMMDEAAAAANRDPVAFRLDYLKGEGADQRRVAGVLELAAEKAGWGAAPEGRAQGIAVHKSFGSYVAEVVEISGSADDGVKIEKVTCAVDCGIPVNPDVIKAQMEGGIGYGIGHIMRDEITLTEGVVDQYNFPDYEPLRISDIGAIEVHIVPSTEAPSGVGEPGTPPAGPALANAIAASGGPRVLELPMVNSGVNFV
ncbi:xanthine dehydrogenase family protein molybdopterin-binding subunit [Mameliella sediminis]|uniref:xanthine dehydrogenase family protein molybdopterin-binding subunit n=1 Tax=Mameliella sediminis TaxID=2836866 RepID=UPI001C46A24F|nr:molybdopterin cofactor-binding domain-containing protein [Mameliella sediminis]MBV7397228.1 molybdopterin-dependent oxidoreductase [Mameliella sediminis]